ncbi:thioredoxin reductase TR2 [Gonapodya prolifera JEL478]|uniref:thioredoxin-disulfide reductase (NADPH) n=1 Tax=Gonapodya prolifera (strain JEL478) TaxID=1344416 RepID=A0A139A6V4_GONPJ|nr:thioredoxin reductase TR2 [Gonapodya prolifera JEL478]|eukprot:KXS12547.1 thioredoxin reductase TR2 [Gonapodya prolifera JEL478]
MAATGGSGGDPNAKNADIIGLPIPELVQKHLERNKVALFSKTWCPWCRKAKALFNEIGVEFNAIELDLLPSEQEIQDYLKEHHGIRSVPQVYIRGQLVGGFDKTKEAHDNGSLHALLEGDGAAHSFDYDMIVIGGGSGGLACSREAAKLGKKVAVLDYVRPSPPGTKWGLGGTCVNVGCIPKKLYHTAGLVGQTLEDAKHYGWNVEKEKVQHNWEDLKSNIQDHIGSINWGYRVALRDENVEYINGMGEFVDPHTVKVTTFNRKTNAPQSSKQITARHIVIAVGGRPKYLDLPAGVDRELCITSDDLFSLSKPPGKTLVVGASYVSLECAGFLTELGYDTTVMARSIFLRGFDQECAEKIVDYMSAHGTKFIRPAVPINMEKTEQNQVKVTWSQDKGTAASDVYDTVVLAVGRVPETRWLGLDKAGVVSDGAGKLVVNQAEQTNIQHIFGIGDVLQDKPELTPLAIQTGKLLSRRLYQGSSELTDYDMIPTTVFTPLEYGSIGLSEEAAIAKFGESNIEVYHSYFKPLEWTVPHREDNACFTKLICVRSENDRVVGFHYLGPNAGEVTQGYAVAMRLRATKSDFAATIGIHPTTSEEVIKLRISKSSGSDAKTTGC